MAHPPAFVAPVAAPFAAHPRSLLARRRRPEHHLPSVRASATTPPPPPPPPPPSPLKLGTIVAVREGARVSVARVAGAAADGRTVDLAPLKEFVRELYVADRDGRDTYARAADVREVRSEYSASQDGWIVLDADVDAAAAVFKARATGDGSESVVVEEARRAAAAAVPRERGFGFPRPTRAQAIAGAVACAPLSAFFFRGWAGARGGLGEGEGFGRAVLSAGAVGTVGCAVLGLALLAYAATYAENEV